MTLYQRRHSDSLSLSLFLSLFPLFVSLSLSSHFQNKQEILSEKPINIEPELDENMFPARTKLIDEASNREQF